MTAPLHIPFVKCHGSGNDFPLIDARALSLGEAAWAMLARQLSDRAGPVGSDGLLALTVGDEGHAFGFRMWNADGSEAETCLNGVRCVARAGFAALGLDRASVRLMSSSADVARDADLAPGVYTVCETAGPASLDAAAWLRTGADTVIDAVVAPLDPAMRFTAVAMPNPHLVTFVDAIDEAVLVRLGERCEAAPDWVPGRANVSFVRVDASDALFVRTFERGVGLTDACGSAMAASVFAACLTGRIAWDAVVTIRNAGGLVRARVARDAMVTLWGNATWEWAGVAVVDAASGEVLSVERGAVFGEEAAAWEAVRALTVRPEPVEGQPLF